MGLIILEVIVGTELVLALKTFDEVEDLLEYLSLQLDEGLNDLFR